MSQIVVRVRTPVYPTEDRGKVEKAVLNVASGEVRHAESSVILVGSGKHALEKLYKSFRDRRILAAARRLLLEGRSPDGKTICFELNKQAAYHGVINFSPIHSPPLGVIEVVIECDDALEVINWLCPPAIAYQPRQHDKHRKNRSRR